MRGAEVRPRTEADLPSLVEALGRQQPVSGYPFRWPLPIATLDFLRRDDELASWVVVVDDQVRGHVALAADAGTPGVSELWTAAHGAPLERLAVVSALFVDPEVNGRGLGAALLDAAVAWARERDLAPCLDVLPGTHGRAAGFYRRRGWVAVGEFRFAWQPDDEPPALVMVLPGETPHR